MTKADILEKYPPSMENVLLILHEFQSNHPRNFLSEKDLSRVADYLNATLGSIYGIASYYSMFSLTPRGRHIIRICRSPVCRLAGVVDVGIELAGILQIDIGQTTSDWLFTLETTECLGQCDSAPAMTVDETVYGNLTPARIKTIVGQYRKESSPKWRRKG